MDGPPSADLPAGELAGRIRGDLLTPADEGYEDARRIWNARLDRHPGLIVRCATEADVAAAVDFARERGVPPAVRGGGHDYAGHSTCDGGLLIDLSRMRDVRVDPDARTARVQAGATWAEVDRATQAVGLATTGGTVSTVGVAGYTLGGGSGHLARAHGLAVDNLLAADLVTADGTLVRASADENADLFWALRGGGGNFGVATAFEYRLHGVGPEILAGQIVYPLDDAPEVLRVYRDVMADAPDELNCYAFFIRVPPIPAFPERAHGAVAIDLVVACAGGIERGREAIRPLRRIAAPILDRVEPQPYRTVQSAFDEGVPKGLRWYSKAHYLAGLPDEAIGTLLRFAEALRGPYTMVYLEPLGGAVGRVEPTATAFPHRHAPYGIHVLAGWEDPAEDDDAIGWARAFHEAMTRHATGGVYLNLLGEDEEARVRAAWGVNYERLLAVKNERDPENLFRMNHNVRAAV